MSAASTSNDGDIQCANDAEICGGSVGLEVQSKKLQDGEHPKSPLKS